MLSIENEGRKRQRDICLVSSSGLELGSAVTRIENAFCHRTEDKDAQEMRERVCPGTQDHARINGSNPQHDYSKDLRG